MHAELISSLLSCVLVWTWWQEKRGTMEEALADAPVICGEPVIVAQADVGDGCVACRVEVLPTASLGGFWAILATPHLVRCAPLGGQEP